MLAIYSSSGRGGGPLTTFPSMTGANVVFLIGMPGKATTEMSANIKKDSHMFVALPYDKETIVGRCSLPAIYPRASYFKSPGNSNGILCQWA